jgi:hypothetical protein
VLRRLTRAQRLSLASAGLLLTLSVAVVGLLAARAAHAKIANNTISPGLPLSGDGRRVLVSGPITCTAGERAYIRATVTQRTSGAVAEGDGSVACTGEVQTWRVAAQCQTKESFAPGTATAVGLARTFTPKEDGHGNGPRHQAATDSHQWLVSVTLASE